MFRLESLFGILIPSGFLSGSSFIQDLAIVLIVVVLLAIVGLLIYAECTGG